MPAAWGRQLQSAPAAWPQRQSLCSQRRGKYGKWDGAYRHGYHLHAAHPYPFFTACITRCCRRCPPPPVATAHSLTHMLPHTHAACSRDRFSTARSTSRQIANWISAYFETCFRGCRLTIFFCGREMRCGWLCYFFEVFSCDVCKREQRQLGGLEVSH